MGKRKHPRWLVIYIHRYVGKKQVKHRQKHLKKQIQEKEGKQVYEYHLETRWLATPKYWFIMAPLLSHLLGVPPCIFQHSVDFSFGDFLFEKKWLILVSLPDLSIPQKTSLPCPLVFWSDDFEPKIERNLQKMFILKSASFNDHVLSFRHFGSSESIQTTKSVLGGLVNIPQ